MKRLLLPLLTALALPTAVNAEVDPKVHNLCLTATDYIGCVKAQSGFINQSRITVDEGLAVSKGNACPANMAYIGGGTCQRIMCSRSAFGPKFGRHDQLIKDKGWVCKGGGLLKLDIATAKAFNNPNCPDKEPEAGWNSSCTQKDFEEGRLVETKI